MKRFSPVFVLLVAVLVAGCGGGGSAKLGSNDVAVVGSQHIGKSSFESLMQQQRLSLKSQGQKFPKPGTTQYASLRTQVVQVLVQNAELEAEAAKLGVTVSDKDVSTQLDQMKKQYFGGSEKRYEQQLKQQGYTDDAVRDQIRLQLLSQKLFDKVTANVQATDKQVHAYYVAHKSQYPPTRDVQEILVGKGKEALAQRIYKQVKGGADFAKLAKKYSQDPGSKDLGGKFTAQKGRDVPEFDKAVFSSAKTGTLLAPVETKAYGWFVIKLVGPVKPQSEAQVADTIRAQLDQDARNKQMTSWVEKVTKTFCKGGKIQYQTGYAPVPDPCASLSTSTNATTTG